MKPVYLFFTLIFSTLVSANESVDLEQNMKNTGLAYKKSIQATDLKDFNNAIDRFIKLVEVSKTAKFHQEPKLSKEGLDKVIKQAKIAKEAANTKGLAAAKAPLKRIDELRKKYHELHEPPGFFELIFGK